jgi:hypothetical protein
MGQNSFWPMLIVLIYGAKNTYCKEKQRSFGSKEVGHEVNTEKMQYIFISCPQNVGQHHNLWTGNKSLTTFKY